MTDLSRLVAVAEDLGLGHELWTADWLEVWDRPRTKPGRRWFCVSGNIDGETAFWRTGSLAGQGDMQGPTPVPEIETALRAWAEVRA